MEYRPHSFARAWSDAGHEATVVAGSFSHVRQRQPQISAAIAEEFVEGVRFLWLRTPEYAGNGAARARNILTFAGRLTAAAAGLAKQERPDVVIASSTHPLDIAGAARMARLASARLIYEVHDLWPLTPMEVGGMSPRHPFIRLLQWAEDYACRRADLIVSMLPCAEAHFLEHGMKPGRFLHIPNGIDPVDFIVPDPMPPAQVEQIQSFASRYGFVVGYAGAHGPANALTTVLDAAALLKGSGAAFVLAGQGQEKQALMDRVRDEGLDNVLFVSPLPRRSVPSLLEAMDALYIGLAPSPLFRFGISPNKLMDYMMAAKPVIQAVDAGNDMVAAAGCGITIKPGNPRALAEAVLRMMSMTPESRAGMGGRGRVYVTEHHDQKTLAGIFLDAMLELTLGNTKGNRTL